MKKPIIIRENGKRIKHTVQNKLKNKRSFEETSSMQAATLQESDHDPVPTFAVQSDSQYNKSSKRYSRFGHFKPILIAIISAISIATVLGFIMIRMFAGVDTEITGNASNNLPVIDNNDKNETEAAETNAISLKPLTAYVIQAGVFSEKANAESWAEKYHNTGLPTMIWQRENQFYLLIGLAASKEQAKKVVGGLKEYSFDMYVKEWSTGKSEAKLTQAEQEWFQSFQEQWNTALTSLSNQEDLAPANWEKINANSPKKSERVLSMVEETSKIERADGMEAQVQLLNLWNKYEKAIK